MHWTVHGSHFSDLRSPDMETSEVLMFRKSLSLLGNSYLDRLEASRPLKKLGEENS